MSAQDRGVATFQTPSQGEEPSAKTGIEQQGGLCFGGLSRPPPGAPPQAHTSPHNGRQSALGTAAREWCGLPVPRARALGDESSALRAGLDAFGLRSQILNAPALEPPESGELM